MIFISSNFALIRDIIINLTPFQMLKLQEFKPFFKLKEALIGNTCINPF